MIIRRLRHLDFSAEKATEPLYTVLSQISLFSSRCRTHPIYVNFKCFLRHVFVGEIITCRKLSLEEHKQLGLLLEMARTSSMFSNKIYKTNVERNASLETKIEKSISKLKALLEDQLFEDYRQIENLNGIYYGRGREAEQKLS